MNLKQPKCKLKVIACTMRSQNWDIENIILTNVEMLHLQYSAEVVEQKLIIFFTKTDLQ